MSKTVVQVQVRAVLPTKEGCAVFLGNSEKIFVIYVDQTVGAAITMFMRETPKERPLTHDLMANIMMALGAKVERVIINELKNATYFARLIVSAGERVAAAQDHRDRRASERLHRDGDAAESVHLHSAARYGTRSTT